LNLNFVRTELDLNGLLYLAYHEVSAGPLEKLRRKAGEFRSFHRSQQHSLLPVNALTIICAEEFA